MIPYIVLGIILAAGGLVVLGGWLHYRFGATVVNTARVLEAAVTASKK